MSQSIFKCAIEKKKPLLKIYFTISVKKKLFKFENIYYCQHFAVLKHKQQNIREGKVIELKLSVRNDVFHI